MAHESAAGWRSRWPSLAALDWKLRSGMVYCRTFCTLRPALLRTKMLRTTFSHSSCTTHAHVYIEECL